MIQRFPTFASSGWPQNCSPQPVSRFPSLARLPHKAQSRIRMPLGSPQKPSSATIQAWLATALRHFDVGQMAEAERQCLQILARDVRHADALYVLGIVAYRTNRLAAAVSMIRSAIAVNSRQPFYHVNLGNVLSAQGKFDEAIPCFERALLIDPNLAEASYNLGNAFREQKKLDQAATCYQRAISVKPSYVDAMCNLGVVYGMQNKLDQAVDINRCALALAPDRADLLCNLGDIFRNRGKPALAVSLFERALALKPDFYKAANSCCNSCFDLGDLNASIAWNRRTLAIKPNDGEALMNKSLLELLQGDYASGWRNYEARWKVYTPRVFSQPL